MFMYELFSSLLNTIGQIHRDCKRNISEYESFFGTAFMAVLSNINKRIYSFLISTNGTSFGKLFHI